MRSLIVASLLTSILLAGCSKKAEFKPFHSTEGRFSVSVPFIPSETTRQAESLCGPLIEHDFVTAFDDVGYGINYIQIPDQLNEILKGDVNLAMKLGQDGLLSHVKGRLLGTRGVRIDSTRTSGTELAVALADGKHNLTVRIYLANSLIYQVHAVLPKSPSYTQELNANRFLDSFEIQSK